MTKRYSKKEKERILQMINSDQFKSISAVAAHEGLPPSTIHHWANPRKKSDSSNKKQAKFVKVEPLPKNKVSYERDKAILELKTKSGNVITIFE
jgi:transposase-like protein